MAGNSFQCYHCGNHVPIDGTEGKVICRRCGRLYYPWHEGQIAAGQVGSVSDPVVCVAEARVIYRMAGSPINDYETNGGAQ